MGCGMSSMSVTTQEEAVKWFTGDSDRYYILTNNPREKLTEAQMSTKCSEMESLRIHSYPGYSDPVALSTLACPNVTEIVLFECDFQGDKAEKSSDKLRNPFALCARNATKMTRFTMKGCKTAYGPAFLSFVKEIPNPKALVSVSFEESWRVDDATIEALAAKGPINLEYFNVNHCHHITGTSLAKIVVACPKLKEFHIAQTKLNGNLFRAMAEHKLPQLSKFTTGDADVSTDEEVQVFVKAMGTYRFQMEGFTANRKTKIAQAFAQNYGAPA